MKQLTIGQFNDSFPPAMDGVANTVINYADYFNQKEKECYAVVPYYPNASNQTYGFEVLTFPSIPVPLRRNYRFFHHNLAFGLLRKLKNIDFDIVHAHSPFTAGKIALNIARSKNIPLVATFHSKYREDIFTAVKSVAVTNMIIKRIVDFYNRCDVVWVVNNATGKTLEEYGYKKEYRVAVNGCDFPIEEGTDKERDFINSKYGLDNSDRLLLFVGQHELQKNTKLILESLDELRKQEFDFKMLFVGDGSKKQYLERMANRLGLADRVFFIGKILDRNLLCSIFKRGDLLVFPSLYDNAPIVVREAAAGFTPSLLIENSNAAECVVDNYNGFLVPKPCKYEISKRIVEIFEDDERLRLVSKNASRTVCVPWEKVLCNVQKQYRQIITDFK